MRFFDNRKGDNMITSPNQKKITISKVPLTENKPYLMIDLETLQIAMKELRGESFRMWVYLAKNIDHYELALSPADAAEWGILRDSYHKAVKTLIDKNYLVQTGTKNQFTFYERPQIDLNENIDNVCNSIALTLA